MAVLVVPGPDEKPWPTLGREVCEFLEDRAVHGPGDLKCKPYRLDDEKRAFLYRAYEVFPKGHQREGKRRFKRVALSLRKGTAKTELAAAVCFVELHPEGPVRCDGFRRKGSGWIPVGRPVVDPYIPMVAYTEEQTEDLAYAALLTMVTEGTDADLFDAGLERIIRLGPRGRPDGKAAALASAPDARDGARTTLQHFDETHRFTLPRLVESHETMLQNIPKRMGADAWSLETTTTYTPGEGSVAQATHEEAEGIASGKISDSTFFFFHREAATSDRENLGDPLQLRAVIREASGPAIMGWDDAEGQVESIASLYHQAARRGNAAYFERVWLNRRKQGSRQAFDRNRWDELARPHDLPFGQSIVLGLDGSKWRDSTGIVATHLETGWQWLAGWWEHDGQDGWEVPVDEVEGVLDATYDSFDVVRLYGDPANGWDQILARRIGKYGPKRVVEFHTDSRGLRRIAVACRSHSEAVRGGGLTHSGDPRLAAHIGAAVKRDVHIVDDDGHKLWVLEKERRDSPFKVDYAMASVISWTAYLDALTGGWSPAKPRRMVVMG